MTEKNRPGVMLYFDIRPCLKRLSSEEKGQLFEGILDYAEFGVIPEFEGMVGVAWDFILPRLDRDAENYKKQVDQRQYAVFVREIKKKGNTPVAFEEWKALSELERNRLLSADEIRYPTTTSSSTTTTTTTSSSTTTSTGDKGENFRKTKEAEFEDQRRAKIQAMNEYIAKTKGD